jgi:hypothetical protein
MVAGNPRDPRHGRSTHESALTVMNELGSGVASPTKGFANHSTAVSTWEPWVRVLTTLSNAPGVNRPPRECTTSSTCSTRGVPR